MVVPLLFVQKEDLPESLKRAAAFPYPLPDTKGGSRLTKSNDMKKIILLFTNLLITGALFCAGSIKEPIPDERTSNFPKQQIKVEEMPERHNLWIFLLAGQSNMAGRGKVEPRDTIPDKRILTITKNKQWSSPKNRCIFMNPGLLEWIVAYHLAENLSTIFRIRSVLH